LVGYLILGFFTVLAIVLAVRSGVFRRESVIGPKRLADRGDAGPLLLIMIIGLFFWLFSQVVYGAYKGMQLRNAGVEVRSTNVEDLLDAKDLAVMSTAPFVIGFFVLLLGNKLFRRDGLKTLGLGLRQFGSGVRAGIVGFLIIVPAVYWTLMLTEIVLKIVHWTHPEDHPLIKALRQAQDPVVKRLLIIGATLCAPFFEEFLFRGHVQTLLRYLFMRMSARWEMGAAPTMTPPTSPPFPPSPIHEGAFSLTPPPPPVAPGEMLQAARSEAVATEPASGPTFDPGAGVPPAPVPPWLPYFPAPFFKPHLPPLQPKAWHGWLAIVITSLAFALLHPAWSWPAIFVLAIGLGYLYERTGNLWAPITVHLLFNSLETLISQLAR
jgi:membrane protease YdiL (CAAX protease family)